MDVLNIIRQKAIKPIQSSEFITQTPFRFEVKFEDGSVAYHKDDPGLRMWAVCIQKSYFESIFGSKKHCTELPISYYDLLGFRSGDAVLIRNDRGIDLPILFS